MNALNSLPRPQAETPLLTPAPPSEPIVNAGSTGSGRRSGVWLVLGAVLLAAAFGAALREHVFDRAPAPAQAVRAAESLPPGQFRLSEGELRSLRIEPVGLRDFRAERVAEGRITINEDRATPVFAPYTGRVLRAGPRLGESVAAGDTLFEIETGDLAGAAGDLLAALDAVAKARVTLDQARREERRQGDLLAARATSQREVEQARSAAANAGSDLRTAEANLAAGRDKLRVLGRSTEQIRRIEESRGVNAVVPVTAPIAGTVVQRRVGPGQWIAAGGNDPVFTIADLSTVWLVAAVREIDAPLIRVGQRVEVTVGALGGRVFEARIAAVGAGLDPGTRRLTVRAEVDDPERLLRPEGYATFRIAVGEPVRRAAVPAGAVIHRGAEASVWVALEDRRFVLRPVRLGLRAGELWEVKDGLAEHERVVTGGALFIDRAARID